MKFNKIALFVAGGSLVMASHAFGGSTALPADATQSVDASVTEMLYHNIESSDITEITVDYTNDLQDVIHTVKFCSVSSDVDSQFNPGDAAVSSTIDGTALEWSYESGVYTSTATLIQPQDSAGTSLAYTITDKDTSSNGGKCGGQPGSLAVGKEALSTITLTFDSSQHANGSENTLESGTTTAGSLTFVTVEASS